MSSFANHRLRRTTELFATENTEVTERFWIVMKDWALLGAQAYRGPGRSTKIQNLSVVSVVAVAKGRRRKHRSHRRCLDRDEGLALLGAQPYRGPGAVNQDPKTFCSFGGCCGQKSPPKTPKSPKVLWIVMKDWALLGAQAHRGPGRSTKIQNLSVVSVVSVAKSFCAFCGEKSVKSASSVAIRSVV